MKKYSYIVIFSIGLLISCKSTSNKYTTENEARLAKNKVSNDARLADLEKRKEAKDKETRKKKKQYRKNGLNGRKQMIYGM